MATESHSFGPTCMFYDDDEESNEQPTAASTAPKVKAQFFYVSSLPIDDPLSPLPPIQADKADQQPPKPFSARDNAALEEAWSGFRKEQDRERRPSTRGNGARKMFSFPQFQSGLKTPETQTPPIESRETYFDQSPPMDNSESGSSNKRLDRPQAMTEDGELRSISRRSTDKYNTVSARDFGRESQVMLAQCSGSGSGSPSSRPVDSEELTFDGPKVDQRPRKLRSFSPFPYKERRKDHAGDQARNSQESLPPTISSSLGQTVPEQNSDISGRPFARVPSRRQIPAAFQRLASYDDSSSDEEDPEPVPTLHQRLNIHHKDQKAFVPVGVSKLHLVELPSLIMKPIYWSPINDTSSVIRATWFFKDSMMPVPADIANLLEIGYEDMKPFSESYQDELNACIEVGPEAETKLIHKLWPNEKKLSRPNTANISKVESRDSQEGNSPDLTSPENLENAAIDPRKTPAKRLFETNSVIYVDESNAQILRPSLLPSASKGRRPLSAIRKGREIGVAVVRGFNRKVWLKAHPNPKMDAKVAQAKVGAYMSQSGDATTRDRRMSCGLCEQAATKPKVTDLVLVVHGIGQKLSERVDSFHFTHAINGLRREFNVELASEAVQGNVRADAGIMVLPVNWRLTVKFDSETKSAEMGSENKFSLQDITPPSLPAVRSIISDVMLDIPYYLSHHKQTMTAAVIREANRVYRLWCRNNPGFQEFGRVHLVAHSLGSAMAVDILSQQPTKVPAGLSLKGHEPSDTMFEFNTTNLFCCGSPVGFFLLLNGASLIPRMGREKPGLEGEDAAQGIAGERGRYGCLAVNNLYNICHRYDPVAYQMNAAVDREYAVSLKTAFIPPASIGLMTRIGNSLRWTTPQSNDYGYSTVSSSTARPQFQHMPSTVEMETHNFTREEIAEKRMNLLNENGQIDFFLNAGGGPLEIQYLNMLSAHSSYWLLRDFTRFLVLEIGRKPGKANTLAVLRAAKKREYRRGTLS